MIRPAIHKKQIEKGLLTEEESNNLIDKWRIGEIGKAMAEDNEIDMIDADNIKIEAQREKEFFGL